ncbi:RICIN domain-containing protein [Streptomyces coeruleorubidus]|jgi:hypothetical protein|uniref:RICIN domain-containing protein n=1 Tax=Streptomyces coeruleorubidus TaxID=116188 RepID=UPI0033B8058F
MLKRIAAVGAAAALVWGLGTAPASARSDYFASKNIATGRCLDYRSDYGIYATGCNGGAYQAWLMDETASLSKVQQKATGLCLVARNGQAVMRTCVDGDPAAVWQLKETSVGTLMVNNVTKTCLAEGSDSYHHVNLSSCTGGSSQQWLIYYV